MSWIPAYLFCLLPLATPVTAQLPPSTQQNELKAAILLRMIELENNIATKKSPVSIYLISAPKLAESLKKMIGKPIGSTTLGRVESGEELPLSRPDVIFIGANRNADRLLKYTRQNKIMSVTDRADLFQMGVSVSILMEKRHSRIQMNPGASLEEGLNWNLDFRQFRSLTLELKNHE